MGLHLVPNNLNINFVGVRKISYAISCILLLAGFISLAVKGGPNYGIDFAGGTIVQIKFENPVADENLKASLAESNLPGLVIQSLGDDQLSYFLRISSSAEDSSSNVRTVVTAALETNLPGQAYEIQRLEMVGPKVGADLRSKAMEALYFATLLIAIYISGRFEQRWTTAIIMAAVLAGGMFLLEFLFQKGNEMGLFTLDPGIIKGLLILAACILTAVLCFKLKLVFALGAIVSIVHDLFITVGVFSILDKEFDLTIIAALLTIVGYSLNDTIIVYDRIRENLRGNKNTPLSIVINRSINQTLSRTTLTSGTTLLVVLALLTLGGGIIHDFALVMFIGVFVGTASSIFVASPVLLAFGDTVISQAAAADAAEKGKVPTAAKRHSQV